MTDDRHRTLAELEAARDEILQSPRDHGSVELVVRRPAIDERELLEKAELDPDQGLVGDNWRPRGSSKTPDGSAHPGKQLTLMSSRVAALVAGARERWPLAGDQLYVDLDLSQENLPPGTRLSVGTAVVEVSEQPHTGCRKFVERFGADAMRFIGSPAGLRLNLRGINARVIQAGSVQIGDELSKL